jgi:hypothetical protein
MQKRAGKEINELKADLTEEELKAIDTLHAVIIRDHPELNKETTG